MSDWWNRHFPLLEIELRHGHYLIIYEDNMPTTCFYGANPRVNDKLYVMTQGRGPVLTMIQENFNQAISFFNLKAAVNLLGWEENPVHQHDCYAAVFIGPLTGSATEEHAMKHTLFELGIRPSRQAFLTVKGCNTVPSRKKKVRKCLLGTNADQVHHA